MSVVETLLSDRKSLMMELVEAKEQIVAYQIAKDNLELRLRNAQEEWLGVSLEYCPHPPHSQVY